LASAAVVLLRVPKKSVRFWYSNRTGFEINASTCGSGYPFGYLNSEILLILVQVPELEAFGYPKIKILLGHGDPSLSSFLP
jgi:hypothetical protein